jgi:hypothetical protein
MRTGYKCLSLMRASAAVKRQSIGVFAWLRSSCQTATRFWTSARRGCDLRGTGEPRPPIQFRPYSTNSRAWEYNGFPIAALGYVVVMHIGLDQILRFALVLLVASVPVALPATFTLTAPLGAQELTRSGKPGHPPLSGHFSSSDKPFMRGEQPDVSSNVSVDVDSAQRSVHEVAETWKTPTQVWTKV